MFRTGACDYADKRAVLNSTAILILEFPKYTRETMNFKQCITYNVYRRRVSFNGLTFYDYLMTLSVAKNILQGRMLGKTGY